MTSTEHSFESCDRSTFDRDYCPWTDDAFSDCDFAREEVVQNTEDCSNNNVNDRDIRQGYFKDSLLFVLNLSLGPTCSTT